MIISTPNYRIGNARNLWLGLAVLDKLHEPYLTYIVVVPLDIVTDEGAFTIESYLDEPTDTFRFLPTQIEILVDLTSKTWQNDQSRTFKRKYPQLIQDNDFLVRMIDADFNFVIDEPFIRKLVMDQLAEYNKHPEAIEEVELRDRFLRLYGSIVHKNYEDLL